MTDNVMDNVMQRDSAEWQEASRITNSIWQMARDIDEYLFLSSPSSTESREEINSRWNTCFDIARTAIQTQQIVEAINRLSEAKQ